MHLPDAQSEAYYSIVTNLHSKGYLLQGMYELQASYHKVALNHDSGKLTIEVLIGGKVRFTFAKGKRSLSTEPATIVPAKIGVYFSVIRDQASSAS